MAMNIQYIHIPSRGVGSLANGGFTTQAWLSATAVSSYLPVGRPAEDSATSNSDSIHMYSRMLMSVARGTITSLCAYLHTCRHSCCPRILIPRGRLGQAVRQLRHSLSVNPYLVLALGSLLWNPPNWSLDQELIFLVCPSTVFICFPCFI